MAIPAQQLGDAFVQLADTALATGGLPVLRTVSLHVVVRIDRDDLADPATGPATATTGFGALLSAARARMLARDGSISRIALGPDSIPLDLGRTHRAVPPHLRRAVEARDRTCVVTGCGARANSALLCERHHTKVHHGFRVERPPDGRGRTYRPDGTEIIVGPPIGT
ncbi:DUF222 domain-containing protein [Blastococcus sp. CT_GayMR20]|uniref:DUF222 domain-containing protein n=1 Tax=Blastococcus sp. CT_GayMR20 TaxID=2559609 RepID=UPI00107388CA|nr:DUF222 domain-containing protein [Blastococcus sp. CT_GayMR20]